MIAIPRRHVVVVGGGISGLAAAWFLRRDAASSPRVTVLEGSDHLGGKLRVSDVGGVAVDEGAEALLLRRPEGADLVSAVGAGTLLPALTTAALLWTRGRFRSLPGGTVMGIPTDLRALARSGVLTPWELARIPWDSWLPATSVGADVPVGRYVGARLGRAVVERLVEPLLGGVYAGHADLLSLDATLPQLAAHARHERSLLAAAQAARAESAATGAVFGSLRGGLGRLPAAVAAASGASVRTDARVRELRRTPQGWELTVGSAAGPETVTADAVVLAVPAAPAARLLSRELPTASADLAAVAYASMAIVTLAFPSGGSRLPEGSGYLVPPVDGHVVKAATFSTSKWGWYAEAAPGIRVVRLSVGRLGEEEVLQRDDAELTALALAELREAVGPLPEPIDRRVTRWGGGLPQYAVGHRSRVERIRAAVADHPGLAVCGAAYDGVGIPACVASGGRAAEDVLRQWSHV
jgi:oxygen-dependent protoporphyrinogen oxidase